MKSEHKTDAQWYIETPFGICTIYNYKDGKNYCGKNGLALKDITNWHLGGLDAKAPTMVELAIEAFTKGLESK